MSIRRSIESTSDPRINFDIGKFGTTGTGSSIHEPVDTSLIGIDSLSESMEILVNKTGELKTEFSERPFKYNAQIFDLGDPDYNLQYPILISMESYLSTDSVIASFPELEVFGEGTTEAEAIGNLKSSILDLYDELHEINIDELGELPRTWLRILNNLIEGKHQ